jgi:uncharacterized protein
MVGLTLGAWGPGVVVRGHRNQPHAEAVNPGPRFWPIFTGVCRNAKARGKLIPDAYLAALATEHGCELVSDDRDFRRFPRLRWRHPLD